MNVLLFLIPISIILLLIGIAAFFWAVRSWSLVDTRAYPTTMPVMVLSVSFSPRITGLFLGHGIRESDMCGNTRF